jgi:hypothetical protein
MDDNYGHRRLQTKKTSLQQAVWRNGGSNPAEKVVRN